jgi:putative hemolysin
MEPAALLALVVILISAGASFFFSLADTAIFSLSRWQARKMNEQHPAAGTIIAQMLTKPQDVLATIVLGNTFAAAAMLAVGLTMALSGRWPTAITVAGLLLLTLVGGEVLPKTLAVRDAERWARRVAKPLLFFQKLTLPLRWLAQELNKVILKLVPESIKPQRTMQEADYQELLEVAFQQGTLAASEKEIILQIINLDRRTAKDVMKPRSRMACIPDDLSIEEMIQAARKFRHRRLPMYDETPDTIVGILNTRALLLDPHIDLADAIEFPSFVPQTMNLLQLFKSLQKQQRGMAIVLDEFGGTAGVITMEDILGELIGAVHGGTEGDGFVMEKVAEGKWRVSGTMRLDDFRREYPPIGEVSEVETMGGLLTHLLAVVPANGEFTTFRGLRLKAQATDERRVRELLVEKI